MFSVVVYVNLFTGFTTLLCLSSLAPTCIQTPFTINYTVVVLKMFRATSVCSVLDLRQTDCLVVCVCVCVV